MNITIQGTMSDEEMNAMRYIFRDAFWEFIRAREGDYVERRYAEQSEAFKENKRKDVEQRLAVAKRLWEAALDIDFKPVNMSVEAELPAEWKNPVDTTDHKGDALWPFSGQR